MEDWERNGCLYRIKKCADEFFGMEDDLIEDAAGIRAWELLGREIVLKETFLTIDLTRLISKASYDQKKNLADLCNMMFQRMEELNAAVKSRCIYQLHLKYRGVARALQEVVAAVVPPFLIEDYPSE